MSPKPKLRVVRALFAVVTALSGATFAFAACSDEPAPASDDAGADAPPTTPTPRDARGPTARGERVFGMDLQASGRDFIAELHAMKEATGMQATNLTFQWDAVEVPESALSDGGDAGDADDAGDEAGLDAGAGDAEAGGPKTVLFNPYFHIANLVYPPEKISVNLALNPVDTNGPHLPLDLAGRKLDDPEVATRFSAMEDYAFAQIPSVDIAMLVLGNEIDLGLGDVQASYTEFATLFAAAATHARQKRPGIKVGFVVSHRAAAPPKRDWLAAAWAASDYVGLTYYPVKEGFIVEPVSGVGKAFDELVAALPKDKPIFVRETGYPSSAVTGSSPLSQAAFVEEIIRAWDRNAARVPRLTYFHSSDYSQASVDELMSYYRLQDPTFGAMLGSFGLRAADGSPKAGFAILSSELKARGW